MNIVEKMKKDWDRRASHDARYWIATEDYRSDDVFGRSGEATARAIMTLIGDGRGDTACFRVLDIGCGIGRVLKPMASHVREIVGIDVSREMVARSVQWLAGVPNVTTRESSGVDLAGFEDGSFDLVYSYVAFQHMPRPVFHRYLAEAHRVLGDSGWLVFQIYLGARPEPPLGDTISLRVYEELELVNQLHENGFRIEARQLEHQTGDGLASWLVLGARDDVVAARNADVGWEQEDSGDLRSPMDGHLYRNLAQNQIAEGRRREAIDTMKQHLEFDAGVLAVALELGTLLVEEGRVEEAIDVLDTVTRVHPDFAEAYLDLAQLLDLVGRRDKAMGVIDRLREGFPDDRGLHQRAERLLAAAPSAARGQR